MVDPVTVGVVVGVGGVVVTAAVAGAALKRAHDRRQGRAKTLSRMLVPCLPSAQLHVSVWQGNAALGVRQAGVWVEVVQLGLTARSQVAVDVVFTVPPGNYSIRADPHDWLLPRQVTPVQHAAAGAVVHYDIEMDPSDFHIHVDADRDGIVDPAPAAGNPWTWGAAGQGAVMLVNNDTDGNPLGAALPAPPAPNDPAPPPPPHAAPDNADAAVNTGADVPDLAPLELRRESQAPLPNTWEIDLAVAGGNESRVRVFDPRGAGGARILGPGPGGAPIASHRFINANIAGQVIDLGMEALEYSGGAFNGIVRLELTMRRRGGFLGRVQAQYTEWVEVRVAPWMVFHHLDPALEVYVAQLQTPAGVNNVAFVGALGPMVAAAGCNLQVLPHATADGWLQDCMEIGYSSIPLNGPPPAPVPGVIVPAPPPPPMLPPLPPHNAAGGGPVFPAAPVIAAPAVPPPAPPNPVPAIVPLANSHSMPTAMRLPRADQLEPYAMSLLAQNFGYAEVGIPANGHTCDCGGNLEATPPARNPGTGQVYPWGRIYYSDGRPGETMDPSMVALLQNQTVQPPIVLEARWLAVNHVDEMISFVPVANVDPFRRFHVLIASPRKAYELLWDASGAGHGASVMMTGCVLHGHAVAVTVDAFLGVAGGWPAALTNLSPVAAPAAVGGGAPTAAAYLHWNQAVQAHLDNVLNTLAAEIEIPGIVEIPMLFVPFQAAMPPLGRLYEALTAGSVNMLVINGHCIVPDPKGPVIPAVGDLFQAYISRQLNALGLTVQMIDDWTPYHNRKGDVHCATNTRRVPLNGPPRWWEYT